MQGEYMIDEACLAQPGDIVTAACTGEESQRDVHFVGRVIEVSIGKTHPSITTLKVDLLDHVDGVTGVKTIGIRHERKVCIFRPDPEHGRG